MKRGKISKLVCFVTVLCMIMQVLSFSAFAANQVNVIEVSVAEEAEKYVVNATLESDGELSNATVVAAVFNGNLLVKANKQDVEFLGPIGVVDGLEVNVTPSEDYELRLYIWDGFLSMKPLAEQMVPLNTSLSIARKANGVTLNWTAVDGASSYDVYRDGLKIGTVTNNKFEDVYFNTIEEMNEIDTSLTHTYSVKVGKKTSGSIVGSANTSLIKYIDFSKANVTDGTTLDQLNAGANGINVAANGVGLADTFLFDVSDTAKEYTLADLTTMTTKYEALYKYASKSNGIVAIDNNEKALILSGNVHKKSDNSKLTDLTLFTKVTGWQDSAVDDYTVLLTQKTNNDQIKVNALTWGVWKGSLYTWDYAPFSNVKVLSQDSENSSAYVSDDKLSFKPVVDNKYHTYVFDTKLRLDETSEQFTGNASVDANLSIRNGGETSGDATLIKSFALVK